MQRSRWWEWPPLPVVEMLREITMMRVIVRHQASRGDALELLKSKDSPR
jgi:hypothetical protein